MRILILSTLFISALSVSAAEKKSYLAELLNNANPTTSPAVKAVGEALSEKKRQCIQVCFEFYDRPSAEFKACVVKCQNLKD